VNTSTALYSEPAQALMSWAVDVNALSQLRLKVKRSPARLAQVLQPSLAYMLQLALTVDCRQPGARNHGNGVEVTSDRYSGGGYSQDERYRK